MKIIAVIVTYNRKKLLCDCLNSILNQTVPVDEIIVVDNASSDGTKDELIKKGLLSKISYRCLEKNEGCTGGVFEGIKYACEKCADWIWIMDDDTNPFENALEKLVEPIKKTSENIGFVCSKVIWNDGNLHKVNVPSIKKYNSRRNMFYVDLYPYLLVESCSFVSVLINVKCVKKYGLPVKEFFIWQDDIEYTRRITKGDELGIYTLESIVIHQTKENYAPHPYYLDKSQIEKYKSECRNKVYVSREFNGLFKHVCYVCKYLFVDTIKIAKNRKDDKIIFMMANFIWTIKGVFFRPKVFFLNDVD